MVRTVQLRNSRGDEFDLTTNKLLLHTLSGFGHKKSVNTMRIGDRWKLISSEIDQPSPSGTIAFAGEHPYDQYYEFVRFCSYEPLYLLYNPQRSEYRLNVVLSSIDKGELTQLGILSCNVTFTGLTRWYKSYVSSRTNTSAGENLKFDANTGSAAFPINWGTDSNPAIIISDSRIESPCKLTIYGPASNPTWSVYRGDGKTLNGGINLVLAAGERLEIDCRTGYSVRYYDASGELLGDRYQNLNFNQDNFVWITEGTNTISVHGVNPKYRVDAMIQYESV